MFVYYIPNANRVSCVCVLEHPFYGLTDVNGMFKLSGLPPGAYVIEAAHPREGRLKREVTIGTSSATMDFILPGRTSARPHDNAVK